MQTKEPKKLQTALASALQGLNLSLAEADSKENPWIVYRGQEIAGSFKNLMAIEKWIREKYPNLKFRRPVQRHTPYSEANLRGLRNRPDDTGGETIPVTTKLDPIDLQRLEAIHPDMPRSRKVRTAIREYIAKHGG